MVAVLAILPGDRCYRGLRRDRGLGGDRGLGLGLRTVAVHRGLRHDRGLRHSRLRCGDRGCERHLAAGLAPLRKGGLHGLHVRHLGLGYRALHQLQIGHVAVGHRTLILRKGLRRRRRCRLTRSCRLPVAIRLLRGRCRLARSRRLTIRILLLTHRRFVPGRIVARVVGRIGRRSGGASKIRRARSGRSV